MEGRNIDLDIAYDGRIDGGFGVNDVRGDGNYCHVLRKVRVPEVRKLRLDLPKATPDGPMLRSQPSYHVREQSCPVPVD